MLGDRGYACGQQAAFVWRLTVGRAAYSPSGYNDREIYVYINEFLGGDAVEGNARWLPKGMAVL